MNKTKISAKIVADSISPQGDRLTSLLITFPRILLSEINTHRMLSKNTSSSRAIPFLKMVEAVQNNPFIPFAWQKHHSGMQGNEYHTGEGNVGDINYKARAERNWLRARDFAVEQAKHLYEDSLVTKQLCNRLLEPFMYHIVLVTATEWENFFELRCPKYHKPYETIYYRSKKDLLNSLPDVDAKIIKKESTNIDWLQRNKGAAEIHIMDLAEKMWDVYNESTPNEQVVEYNTLWIYASASKGYVDRDGNKINRSGFYILTPVQNHINYIEVIEIDMRTNDEYHVKVYGETDEISDINYTSACSNAESFCNWLRQQAPDGHTTYGLQSNYDYWVENCKYKYN